jgi:pimeloyl-ACP methyl ester carboxylesterase
MTAVRIPSHSDELDGTLTLPDGARSIVVLGHGLGAVRAMRLDAFAERFDDAGFATLAFDYRGFGPSGGEPRQWLDIKRQLQDWRAAIAYARKVDGIDKVAIFGTSFGGGHAIRLAASEPGLSAAIAQCPFTNGLASTRTLGVRSLLKLGPTLAHDVVMGRLGRARGVPLAAPPGEAGLMTARDAVPGYLGLVPPDLDFINRVDARIGLHVPLNYPGRAAANAKCPIFFAICDKDSVAPPGPTTKYAARTPLAEVEHYPVGHFEIYQGEPFEIAVADYVDFLKRHLD